MKDPKSVVDEDKPRVSRTCGTCTHADGKLREWLEAVRAEYRSRGKAMNTAYIYRVVQETWSDYPLSLAAFRDCIRNHHRAS